MIGIIMGAFDAKCHPDPRFPEHPQLFWGIVASMLIGNAMLVVLNVPMIRVSLSFC